MKKIWRDNLNILLPLLLIIFISIMLEIAVAVLFGYVIDSANGTINMIFSRVVFLSFLLLITESGVKWLYEVVSYKFVLKFIYLKIY